MWGPYYRECVHKCELWSGRAEIDFFTPNQPQTRRADPEKDMKLLFSRLCKNATFAGGETSHILYESGRARQ
jgi:hypothetical protein